MWTYFVKALLTKHIFLVSFVCTDCLICSKWKHPLKWAVRFWYLLFMRQIHFMHLLLSIYALATLDISHLAVDLSTCKLCETLCAIYIMKFLHGSSFWIIAPLYVNPPVAGGFNTQENSDTGRDLCCKPDKTYTQDVELQVIWDAFTLMWRQCVICNITTV